MRSMLYVLLFSAVLLHSCKNSGKPSATQTVTTKPAPPPNPETSIGKEGTQELMDMITNYYNLKDALVATNGVKADEAASRLMSAAESFSSGMTTVPHDAELQLQPQLKIVMDKSEAIMATKAEAIEEKRTKFSEISDAVYRIATISNLRNAGIYHQFCPMAMNDKGAFWLSNDREIKNPYYGKKMLECGEVKDSL